jgi:cytochrome P450
MCRLIGVPDDDVAVFGAWADDLSPVFGIMTPEQTAAADASITALLAYVSDLVDARRHTAGDDLISRLLAAEEEGSRLSHDEVLAMIANLIVGGHDTTASQVGCTLLTLLRHPDELARLRADRALLASAVSETIRFEPSIAFVPRTAAAPIAVAGAELAAGALVFLATAAANREPGVWKEPDRLDVGRFTDPTAPRLLTFGAGPHYCLGANLAHMTLEEAVAAVADLRPVRPAADLDAVEWRQVLGRAPAALPVAVG